MPGTIEMSRERSDAFAREIQKLQERVGRGEISPEKFKADVEQVKREFGWTGELPVASGADVKARSATAFEDGRKPGLISLDGKRPAHSPLALAPRPEASASLKSAWGSLATDIEAQMKTAGSGADGVRVQTEALRAREKQLMQPPFGDPASVSAADTLREGLTAAYADPANASAILTRTAREAVTQLRQATETSGAARPPPGFEVKAAADGVGVSITGAPRPGSYAALLTSAAARAQGASPNSPQRIAAFRDHVLPVLTESAAAEIFGNPKLSARLQQVLTPAVDDVAALGAKADGSPDPDYPPRAAKALAVPFGEAVGVPKADTDAALAFMEKIAAIPHQEGRYGPTLEQVKGQLGSAAYERMRNVTEALLGEKPFSSLTAEDKAVAALLVLNNLTWHVTNFQRGAGADGTNNNRLDVTARNGTFNTLRDNLSVQRAGHGLDGAAYMSLIDAYNQGKPGIEAAKFGAVPAPH